MYGIFTYIYHKNQPNVGMTIPYMDLMGMNITTVVLSTPTPPTGGRHRNLETRPPDFLLVFSPKVL